MAKSKKYKLTDLDISEVAICGKGMNPEATINIAKEDREEFAKSIFMDILINRKYDALFNSFFEFFWGCNSVFRESVESVVYGSGADKEEQVQEIINEYMTEIAKLVDSFPVRKSCLEVNPMPDNEKIEVQKEQSGVQSSADEKLMSEFSDVEKSFFSTLGEKERSEFILKSKEERKIMVEKAAETVEISGMVLKSSDVSPQILSILKAQAQAIEDASIRLAKAEEDAAIEKAQRELLEYVTKAEKEFANVPGESIKKARLLQESAKMTKESQEFLTATLQAMNESFAKLLESGPAAAIDSGNEPNDQLDKLAKRYAEEHKVSDQEAYCAVLKTDEGKTLYRKSIGR